MATSKSSDRSARTILSWSGIALPTFPPTLISAFNWVGPGIRISSASVEHILSPPNEYGPLMRLAGADTHGRVGPTTSAYRGSKGSQTLMSLYFSPARLKRPQIILRHSRRWSERFERGDIEGPVPPKAAPVTDWCAKRSAAASRSEG